MLQHSDKNKYLTVLVCQMFFKILLTCAVFFCMLFLVVIEMFEITIDHDFRPNDYKVWRGKIVVDPALGFKARVIMRSRGLKMFEKACRMSIYICRRQDPLKKYFGDGDNFCKWIADALSGIVYADDSLIQEYHIYKFKTAQSCLQIRVEEI